MIPQRPGAWAFVIKLYYCRHFKFTKMTMPIRRKRPVRASVAPQQNAGPGGRWDEHLATRFGMRRAMLRRAHRAGWRLGALMLAVLGSPGWAAAETAADDGTVTIVLVGDVGLNSSNMAVDPKGVYRHGFQPWPDTTASIAADFNGDLNFMNLETIVTDRNDLTPDRKNQTGPFNFRMHPEGLKHLIARGFNVLSLANNHSMDYGVPGLMETLRHVGALRGKGILAASGVGVNFEEASRPQLIDLKGSTIAFTATGIVTNNLDRHHAGPDKPGQTNSRFPLDYAEVLKRLRETNAQFRILSVHHGIEGHVRADQEQIAQWRGEAAQRDGIDLIVGHHPHVVRGVEMTGRSLIFYSLGNFLHHGTANMTGKDICRNWGLMARVYLRKDGDGRLAIRAVEAIPVTDTHFRARRLAGEQGVARVHALNYLDATLDDRAGSARGVRFTPQADGSGLYCLPGAEKDPGRIGRLCQNVQEAPPVPPPAAVPPARYRRRS
jgi:poly-gamma-glutamate synthesis protein (capsule biosynthesis protein)